MPMEAVMIIVDNSESSRNGDYQPTRFDAQSDAVGVVFQHIVQGNPESEIGLMSMAGKGPEVLVTMTTEQGKIFEGLHRTKKRIRGDAHLVTSLQVALLALKHRKNKTQRTRIIAFVCSPVAEDEKTLLSLAGKLKKNSVSVDFVLFGDLDEATQEKLQKFNDKVKGSEGSHMVVIAPSGRLLSDQLIATPILLGEGASAAAAGGSGGGGGDAGDFNELGFDPSSDPELALALRMSMEEENARQQKRAREEAEAAKKASLDSVKEEDEAAQPLLDETGQASGSAKKADEGAKDGKDDDNMDTS
ncbi:26S proteasome regulatory subunit s5a [Grosmannia clavigera kw1407]|uniref:26S proteasome regulatory subunit s5a n=1 Tax=Grosmannia clavigera (strain kw1407 / UAMH 11150) TaxID=655863 RepID=F0XC89_GROCL|nr:26S proteasome regulatory subunit s5a [Grosmannia clavigera kw1407]EFX04328.1 26S proteasome regulatory subunit s5a [Grosmannia clavigera kw1407]